MFAALLSPPGRGAIAVIHLCGTGARALVGGLTGRPVTDRPAYGRLKDGEGVADEVMVRTVEGFTGEETVEITCHGGPAPVDRVIASLRSPRVGTPELLERGVRAGHLDRTRAEAWTLLPGARTELAARTLADQAAGALARAVRTMSGPGELLATADLGIALASPRRVVLAGSPNAGKSTLFNALVGSDRALVAPEPGTTRDPVREVIAIDGIPLELVDTAGVEAPRDLLEQLSIDRTHRALREADGVLFLFDAQAGAKEEEGKFLARLAHPRTVVVANKCDAGSRWPPLEALRLSARTGEGMEELRKRILGALGLQPHYREGTPVVFTERQRRILSDTGSLEEAREQLLRGPVV